ncbi:hypothetical protein BDN72DRAFT_781963 [Pluteus cervinus]|uniref:Uncharacterized protein n=1 Tax=Pluteus cervinus TaxID=181527 RepID=A0ACD2ZZH7_9AGAR|nr:hypothetical protein BDN72DRAFT_781963 [Pluteus cervinus]
MSSKDTGPAVDVSGHLKDADDMEFFNSETDTIPLPKPTSESLFALSIICIFISHLQALKPQRPWRRRRAKRREGVTQSDDDDGNYSEDEDRDGNEESDSDCDVGLTNEEIADELPSKTIPAMQAGPGKRDSGKRKRSATMEEIPDPEAPGQAKRRLHGDLLDSVTGTQSDSTSCQASKKESQLNRKNPIHLFYREVTLSSEGMPGESGDCHYKCSHGGKIITIKKSARHNLTTLVTNLKSTSPILYKLFQSLKERGERGERPTLQETDIAAGEIPLDSAEAKAYFKTLDTKISTQTLQAAFRKQAEASIVSCLPRSLSLVANTSIGALGSRQV